MAVTHVVTFTWIDGTTPEGVADILARLQAWIDRGEGARRPRPRGRRGAISDSRTSNAAFGVSASFADQPAYERYRDHPEHRAIISEHIAPRIAARSGVQFAH